VHSSRAFHRLGDRQPGCALIWHRGDRRNLYASDTNLVWGEFASTNYARGVTGACPDQEDRGEDPHW
jgi:hypothetical protein